MHQFTYRSARSAGVTYTLGAVVLIETVALHFLIAARHPAIAWPLTLVSLGAIWWLFRDYRAFGTGMIRLDEQTLHLTIGRRFDLALPVASIARAFAPTFRDLPTPGTTQARDYLNVTKPAAPNVLLELDAPRRVRLPVGLRRNVRRVSLHVDDATALLRALNAPRA